MRVIDTTRTSKEARRFIIERLAKSDDIRDLELIPTLIELSQKKGDIEILSGKLEEKKPSQIELRLVMYGRLK